MTMVLDASVAAAWAFADEGDAVTESTLKRIQISSAIVPSLWWYEIRNVLLVNERRGRIVEEDIQEFLLALRRLRIEIRPPEGGGLTLRFARKYRLTVYDAAYLALAVNLNLPLATLDKRLANAAESEGVLFHVSP